MSLLTLQKKIHTCRKCPRLIRHCQRTAQIKRKSFKNDTYWGKPISGFGDSQAKLIIVGLAPAAHGANRTGRIFTGDRSGDWLYRALHKAGFANQATSHSKGDGLRLQDTWVTCAVKCAPPDNQPEREELHRCLNYLQEELALLKQARVFLVLGKFAYDALWPLLSQKPSKKPAFAHGLEISLSKKELLIASYHPSQQNTFTGRLTESMFDQIFARAKFLLSSSAKAVT